MKSVARLPQTEESGISGSIPVSADNFVEIDHEMFSTDISQLAVLWTA